MNKKRKLDQSTNNINNNYLKSQNNEKYKATNTAFRLARRWTRVQDKITVKKMRKLIGYIEKIPSSASDCISGKLARYLGANFLKALMVKNNKDNNINVKNELEQMLKRKDIWEMNNEMFVNKYYNFIESFESDLKNKELKVENALMYVLKHNNMMTLNENSLVLEFGVASGTSLKAIAKSVPSNQIVYGFDSFQGLPKFWRTGFDVGKFSTYNGKAPIFEEKNIKIIDGLFEETCDIFFKLQHEQKNTIALLHIDCDIYSSTKTIFNAIEKYMNMDIDNNNRINLLRNGTIIVFDELLCYNGFEKHELLAFYEFLQNNPKISYEIIGTKHIGCMSVAIKLII